LTNVVFSLKAAFKKFFYEKGATPFPHPQYFKIKYYDNVYKARRIEYITMK